MLRLPNQIAVTLVNRYGEPLRQPDVLVGVNLLREGRYYYGNLVGLTDRDGRVLLEGAELERRYAADQRNFPMDYKVELIECDAIGELVVLSHDEISQALTSLESFGVSGDFRRMYARAANRILSPAVVRLLLDTENETDPLHVILPALERAT